MHVHTQTTHVNTVQKRIIFKLRKRKVFLGVFRLAFKHRQKASVYSTSKTNLKMCSRE